MAAPRQQQVMRLIPPQSTHAIFEKTIIGFLIVAVLYLGQELFVPLAISVLLAFSLSPVVRFLRRLGIPKGPGVILTVLLTFLGIFTVGTIITAQVRELGSDLPRFEQALKSKVRAINEFAGGEGGAIDRASNTLRDLQLEFSKEQDAAKPAPSAPPGSKELAPIPVEVHPPPPTPLEQIESIISVVLSPLATIGIIIVFVIFLLLQQSDVRDRAIRLIGAHDFEKTTAALDDAGRRLSSYFLSLVFMNAGFGVAIGLGLWAIGIPNAILWGILAMLMRFMPMVGVVIAAAIPVVLAAAVDPGWTMLLAVLALYLVVEGFMNMVVEPLAQSSSTGLSAMAILLAAAFWTLLWGPIGLLIAVPLTAVLVVLGRHVDGLGFLHVLLGDSPPLTPAESFYQRMLAGDPLEAAEQAEKYLKDKSLTAYFDDVVMEGLRHAQSDADQERLEQSRLASIRDSAASMIEAISDPDDIPAPGAPGHVAHGDWQDEGAIICVAGPSALDELGALILKQLLEERGFKPKLMTMADVSHAQLQGDAVEGVKIACISMFDIEHRGAYLKFLVRRLRRILPGNVLLGGFWKHDADEPRQREIMSSIAVSVTVSSLADAVAFCVNAAMKDNPAPPEPEPQPVPHAPAAPLTGLAAIL